MSLSRSSSWPKLSLHYTDINNIMHAEKTLYGWHHHHHHHHYCCHNRFKNHLRECALCIPRNVGLSRCLPGGFAPSFPFWISTFSNVLCKISKTYNHMHRLQQSGCTLLHEMTPWPSSWKYDVVSKSNPNNGCTLIWRTILLNFIPIRFETREP